MQCFGTVVMVCACHAMNTSLGTAVYCMLGECCPTFITWTNSKHMSDIATVGHQLWHLFIINLAHYRLCKQFRLSTRLLYQLFQRLKMFTSDLPWWRRLFNQLAPFVLGLETPSDSKTRLCGLVLLCSVMGGGGGGGGAGGGYCTKLQNGFVITVPGRDDVSCVFARA